MELVSNLVSKPEKKLWKNDCLITKPEIQNLIVQVNRHNAAAAMNLISKLTTTLAIRIMIFVLDASMIFTWELQIMVSTYLVLH